MVYHPYAQQYLLECPYQNIDLALHSVNYADASAVSFLMIWSVPRNLFDYPYGCNRYVSLNWLDAHTDTLKKWEKLTSRLAGIDTLYIINDRLPSGNFIVQARDIATAQAYIYQVEALGIQCYFASELEYQGVETLE